MKASKFIFDSVNLFHYHLQKTSLKRTGLSYIDSPEQLKNKKAKVYPKSNDNNCFQYALTVVLNYQRIKKNPQRMSKSKPFINQYDQKGINFPSHKEDWKMFESNNKSIAINVLFVP